MPRGNLEGICPRALVLAATADALTRRDYSTAWSLATTHRVDLNLLVDWGWPSFLAHASDFVRAVPLASDLCDLLTALQPGSCCAEGGLYASIPMPQPRLGQLVDDERSSKEEGGLDKEGDGSNAGGAASGAAMTADEVQALATQGKVNAVCTAIRQAVQAQMQAQAAAAATTTTTQSTVPAQSAPGDVVGADGVCRALPGSATAAVARELLAVVVTSHARSEPPQLGAALAAVRDAKEAALGAAVSTLFAARLHYVSLGFLLTPCGHVCVCRSAAGRLILSFASIRSTLRSPSLARPLAIVTFLPCTVILKPLLRQSLKPGVLTTILFTCCALALAPHHITRGCCKRRRAAAGGPGQAGRRAAALRSARCVRCCCTWTWTGCTAQLWGCTSCPSPSWSSRTHRWGPGVGLGCRGLHDAGGCRV